MKIVVVVVEVGRVVDVEVLDVEVLDVEVVNFSTTSKLSFPSSITLKSSS